MNIIILVPVFNDFKSVTKLIKEIDINISELEATFSVIVVNDASTEEKILETNNLNNIKSFKLINMRQNKGHARCIAAGLKHIAENEDFDYVIPMDGDGEDRPEEIKEFIYQIKKSNSKPIVGERIKRSENLIFRICYQLHKLITLTFTGKFIKFGNFSCLTKNTVEKMINEKATWNSFSGSLSKIEKDLFSVPSIRGTRYFGPSKMSFFNLLKHSLSIMSVFRTSVLIRSTLFIILYILLIKSYASLITSIPLILLLFMIYSISSLALRENIDEFNNSLKNIEDIKKVK